MKRSLLCASSLLILSVSVLSAQSKSPMPDDRQKELKFVVYLSRHGVRSPTSKPAQYNLYSSLPWPAWSVPPGNLTEHGFRLMRLFGTYDREHLSDEGLFPASGCTDSDRVTIYADSDQRTLETGKAIAAGLFPGCNVHLRVQPEGMADPLFHPLEAGTTSADSAIAVAAINGRIGGDANNLTTMQKDRLVELDSILAKCGAPSVSAQKRVSILDIPAVLSEGKGDHSVDLRGPLNTAATLTENLLLEYTEGMPASDVGWGCVDGNNLRRLIELHTAASDFGQRTSVIARSQASNLLDHIRRALQQAATDEPITGAISRPRDRALFLIGHDTNLSEIASLLRLTWIADGRRDDTPPGASIVFELWHSQSKDEDFIRAYFTTQTLEQMRQESAMTRDSPPTRVPLFLPGCSRQDLSCDLTSFVTLVNLAIDPHSVSTQ